MAKKFPGFAFILAASILMFFLLLVSSIRATEIGNFVSLAATGPITGPAAFVSGNVVIKRIIINASARANSTATVFLTLFDSSNSNNTMVFEPADSNTFTTDYTFDSSANASVTPQLLTNVPRNNGTSVSLGPIFPSGFGYALTGAGADMTVEYGPKSAGAGSFWSVFPSQGSTVVSVTTNSVDVTAMYLGTTSTATTSSDPKMTLTSFATSNTVIARLAPLQAAVTGGAAQVHGQMGRFLKFQDTAYKNVPDGAGLYMSKGFGISVTDTVGSARGIVFYRSNDLP